MRRLPLGWGMGSPYSLAVSIQSWMACLAFSRVCSYVSPWAMQPGSSGTSAIQILSSSLQYIMISYLFICVFSKFVS